MPWVDLATHHGGLIDIKAFLRDQSARRGWSCDPGTIDSTETTVVGDALRSFQTRFNEEFGAGILVDGVCGEDTLGAVYRVLRFELERWLERLGIDPVALPTDRISYVAASSDFARGEEDGAADRRVDLVLVDADRLPEGDLDLSTIYTHRLFRHLDLPVPDELADWSTGNFVVVTDLDPHEPHEEEVFRLTSSNGTVYERHVPADSIVEHGELVAKFEGLDTSASYTLTVTTRDGVVTTIFEAVPYGKLHDPEHRVE